MKWQSEFKRRGRIRLPGFSGIRILMMPILLHDLSASVPGFLSRWEKALHRLVELSPCREGTAYLTIDEGFVPAGKAQRRPGLHVDGWSGDGDLRAGGAWGGGSWGGGANLGMMQVSSHVGCAAYAGIFAGQPQEYGDCEHLREQCKRAKRIVLQPFEVYWMSGMAVHESLPLEQDAQRQFVRLSMPSDAGWNRSNTENPLGIAPAGPIFGARPAEFTNYWNSLQER